MLSDGYHDIPRGKIAMVVTILEMMAKPNLRDIPLPKGCQFNKADLSLADYRDLFLRVGGLDWLWFSRLEMPDAELSAILNDPKLHIYTITKNGKSEGLLELKFHDEGTCELAYFGLTRDLIGTGAGRYLMNQAITRAFDAGISKFHLHTCTLDSTQALGFYLRSGFTAVGRKIEVADDPRTNGTVPKTAAPQTPHIT